MNKTFKIKKNKFPYIPDIEIISQNDASYIKL